jgi:glycosyltransferase involved in cell wall biosynthesis
MNIGIDARPLFFKPCFGIHHHAREIVRAMVADYPRDRYLLFFDGDLVGTPHFDRVMLSSLDGCVEPVALKAFGPTAGLADLAWLFWHLPRAIRRFRVDVFHGFAHALPVSRACPSILTVHDLMDRSLLSWRSGDRTANRGRRILLRSMRRATAISAVSQATADDIQRTNPTLASRVVVIPNGVRAVFARVEEPERLRSVTARLGLPPSGYLLTVGADMPRRNYARLLEALSIACSEDGLAIPLVMVGNVKWATTRASSRARELGILDRVIFCEDVDDADLAALYSAATAYICPTLHEGFGLPIVEAMACGTPVACSDLQVLHEVTSSSAVYFDASDVTSIRRALVEVARRPAPSAGERDRLRAHATRYSWRASARKTRELYETLTRQHAKA